MRLLKSVRRPVPDVDPKIEQTWARRAQVGVGGRQANIVNHKATWEIK